MILYLLVVANDSFDKYKWLVIRLFTVKYEKTELYVV